MKQIRIENDVLDMVIAVMKKSEMLGSLSAEMLTGVAARAELLLYEPKEVVIEAGQQANCFYIIVAGEVAVLGKDEHSDESFELIHLTEPAMLGEIGLLLEQERTATIRTTKETQMLRFDRAIFEYMYEHIPSFGQTIGKFLANRVRQLTSQVGFINAEEPDTGTRPPNELLKMLPMEFLIRHRVLPLRTMEDVLFMGCVDDPTPALLSAIHRLVPGQELRMIRIKSDMFNRVAQSMAGVDGWYTKAIQSPEKKDAPKNGKTETGKETDKKADKEADKEAPGSPRLDALLKRLVAEGASDLHLAAGQIPRWRIDGDIRTIDDSKELEPDEVFKLLEPVLTDRMKKEFKEHNDVDFAYSVNEGTRFRVNLFRDGNGVSAAFRVLPATIFTLDQLRLPLVVKDMCDLSEGLILVTGPSGSGKSTTLAALISHINKSRRCHIITIEDPIEFVHKSEHALVNQREMGSQVTSFARGLRAALREDPDIVLLGEMRDLETIALALEMADTGHLIFATLHTATAVGTVNRIIDMFPAEQQNQIRAVLGNTLKGVISQTLCKRIGGGRVAAYETLVVNKAIGAMIRENKIIQIPAMMQTGKAEGNTFLNEDLCQLTNKRKIDPKEALNKAIDKDDIKRRLQPVGPATDAKGKPIK